MFFMASTDLATFRKFVFESSFLDTYEIDDETIKKIKEDDVELMLFSFKYLAATLFGAEGMTVKPEKVKEKITQMKKQQDEAIRQSVKEYEELKIETAKARSETGVVEK